MATHLSLVREADPFYLVQGPPEVVRFLDQRIEALKQDDLGGELLERIGRYGKHIILTQGKQWHTYATDDHHVIEYPAFDRGNHCFLIVENDDCEPQIEHSSINSIHSDPRVIEATLYHELLHIIAMIKGGSLYRSSKDPAFPNLEEEITTKIEGIFRERKGLFSRWGYSATTLHPAFHFNDVSSNNIRLALRAYKSAGYMEDYRQLINILRQRDQSSLRTREPMACEEVS